MEDISSEVLIYIQKLKLYFKKNNEAKVYFAWDVDDDAFYNHIIEIAEKNYTKNGDPTLSTIQFEFLRKTMAVISISKVTKLPKVPLWMDLGKYGKICSN
jgi:hypothetical protein